MLISAEIRKNLYKNFLVPVWTGNGADIFETKKLIFGKNLIKIQVLNFF